MSLNFFNLLTKNGRNFTANKIWLVIKMDHKYEQMAHALEYFLIFASFFSFQ